jgi:hypothetical protein
VIFAGFALDHHVEDVAVTASQGLLHTAQTSSVVNVDRDRVEEVPGRLARNSTSAAPPFHNHSVAT